MSSFTDHFDKNLWSSFFDQLSRTTRLRYLEISRCQYEFSNAEDEDSETYDGRISLKLPSGVYQMNPDFGYNTTLFLALSGDEDEKLVLSDRTDISVQIKALADRVAQMEVDKVAK